MATFVEMRTDGFEKNREKMDSAITYEGVRRPFRGIEIKEDTYSIIRVMKSNGDAIPLTDSGGKIAPEFGTQTGPASTLPSRRFGTARASTFNYSNYIIQRIEETRQEKSQILETFGDSYIFFFGERPRLLSVSGVLVNTTDFNWRSEFWFNYENVLRGTKLVEQNARVYLFWDDIIVEGYMLGASARDDAETPYHIPFSFTLFVTNHMYLSNVGDENYPITHAVMLEPLLHNKDVTKALQELKAQNKETQKYISKTVDTRIALENAQLIPEPEGVIGSMVNRVSQVATIGVTMLQSAIALGLHAQNLSFLTLVNRFFKNRVMRFPKGMAGGDVYAGEAVYANIPEDPWVEVKRVLPIRSKIRDNVDEYVHGPEKPVSFNMDAINEAELDAQFKTPYALEKKASADIIAMGMDPIRHPGGSFFSNAAFSLNAVLKSVLGFSIQGQ